MEDLHGASSGPPKWDSTSVSTLSHRLITVRSRAVGHLMSSPSPSLDYTLDSQDSGISCSNNSQIYILGLFWPLPQRWPYRQCVHLYPRRLVDVQLFTGVDRAHTCGLILLHACDQDYSQSWIGMGRKWGRPPAQKSQTSLLKHGLSGSHVGIYVPEGC